MAFLDSGDRAELCQAAEAIREKDERNRAYCKREIESYYGEAVRMLGSKKALEDCLRIEKKGTICQPVSPESRAKALSSLQNLDGVSEMVFMSFFHTVYRQFRACGGLLPRPKEIMDMQKRLFGRLLIPTSSTSITMLAYTLGLLKEEELEAYEKNLLFPTQTKETLSPERTENTSVFLERQLEEQMVNLKDFTARFQDASSRKNTMGWRENLKTCFKEICKAHGFDLRYLQFWLGKYGCPHMKSELENSALLFSEEERPLARVPGRNWILAFCLRMELKEEETNLLLRRCSYVPLGFKPWEEGVRYLLRHPGRNRQESLDHREAMFAFLTDCDLRPPSDLFASFPYLATRPGKDDRKLFTSLLLDCLAQVRLQGEDEYLAEFHPVGESPDLLDIFSLKEGCVNLKDQLLNILGLPVRKKLPVNNRTAKDYQQAAARAKIWRQTWKTAEPPFHEAKVMWKLPLEEKGSCCGMQLYALLLYVVYTGHLPMADFRFPAEFHCRPVYWPRWKPVRFTALDEGEVCQTMAVSVLKNLKEG